MTIYAFVGSSGSGKSYRAAWVAEQNGIEYIIDDGLFIHNNKLLAGSSAKKETTKLASVRRALFKDTIHTIEVKDAIAAHAPKSILILGTSKSMIEEIANALGLPAIEKYIFIEDIATAEEIENAKNTRKTRGEHVIPVPTFEIKKDFSGYFLKALQIFNKNKRTDDTYKTTKSVVRPTFSYRGQYNIADHVLVTICQYEALKIADINKVIRCEIVSTPSGIFINMDIAVKYGVDMRNVARLVQKVVFDAIEDFTAINVRGVNVVIKGVST